LFAHFSSLPATIISAIQTPAKVLIGTIHRRFHIEIIFLDAPPQKIGAGHISLSVTDSCFIYFFIVWRGYADCLNPFVDFFELFRFSLRHASGLQQVHSKGVGEICHLADQ
jgi:hypothetical protein